MHTADQQRCRFEKVIPALQMHSLVAQHDFSALRIQPRREIDHRMDQPHDEGQVSSVNLRQIPGSTCLTPLSGLRIR